MPLFSRIRHRVAIAKPPLPSISFAASVLAAGLFLAACQGPQESDSIELDTPPQAFRAVLDGKPRALILRLNDRVRAGYDAEQGYLFKIWRGSVELAGAVYDGRHGPQPTSEGDVYLDQDEQVWAVSEAEMPQLRYAGYELTSDGPVIEYRNADGVLLKELLSAESTDAGIRLVRHFTLTGLPAGAELTLNGGAETRWQPSGEAEINAQGEPVLHEGESRLTVSLMEPLPAEEQDTKDDQHPGLTLIQNSDCAACHNRDSKTVGPAYQAISQRYAGDDQAVEVLAQRIIEGGKGNWGDSAAMTPHPGLSDAEAAQMVEYILSLDVEAPTDDEQKTRWLLDQPAVPANLKPETPTLDGDATGALVHLHYYDDDQPKVDDLREQAPAKAGVVPQIHLPNETAFAPETEHFAYRITANLQLDSPLSTRLRLVSDDGAYLYLNGERLIDNWGFHGPEPATAEVDLDAGAHELEIIYFQGSAGAALSLQWLNPETGEFELLPETMLTIDSSQMRDVDPVIKDDSVVRSIPGDQREVAGVHPSFDLSQARPEEFEPMVGGIDFLADGRMLVSTWDSAGSVYIVEDYDNPAKVSVKRIAHGLAEPLGIKAVDGDIYVMQKQELTRLVDEDGDDVIDRYEVVANDWTVTDNFHEFAFGLEYQDGYFYAALATAILPGGASADPQAPDRGKALKIRKSDGQIEFIAHGLRTPNGVGFGIDGDLFIADNQGDWLPASKIVELTEGAWYGSRSVDFEGTADLTETLPVVWLPQDEIGNSPSEPAPLDVGPYKNQMIHGEVTHGGIKRVYAERVNGRLQGAVFRFTQGLEAGVNRLDWAPDGSLIVGGVGNPGNWSHAGKEWYGLQRMVYNGESAFEMLSVSARSDGFEIEFTQPIKAGQNISAEDFEIQQWYYEPTEEYGGPKKDKTELSVSAFSLSEDRKRAQFKLEGLKEQHLVYFRIKRPFVSESDQSLWTTEAWYTLNALPESQPVEINADYSVTHNRLTDSEKAEGWQLLFDGETLEGLRSYNQDSLGERWVIDDNALHMTGLRDDEEGWFTPDGGDAVITREPVENFELYLEWKLQEDGNSGIIYNVKESPELEYAFSSGLEYQILDNTGHPDGRIEKHRAGDLYDLIESEFVAVNPPGEWNRSRLIVNQGKVQHWLNGYKVVETELWTPEWERQIANSKFADWPHFAQSPGGHIVLQDHANKVWFRNIKLKELSRD